MIERKGDEKVKKSVKIVENKYEETVVPDQDAISEEEILANRRKLAEKLSKKKVETKKSPKPLTPSLDKAGKKPRKWDMGGNNKDLPMLDRSKDRPEDERSSFRDDNKVCTQTYM